MFRLILFLALAVALAAQNPPQRIVVCTDAGSTDAYACTPDPALGSYATGTKVRLYAPTANTTTATVNISSLGAQTIKKVAGGVTTDLDTGDIRAGQYVELIYDGTNFQMLSQLGNAGSSSASDPLTTIDKTDEFMGGGNSSLAVGEMGWSFTTGTVSSPGVGAADIWGWFRRNTAATATSFATTYLWNAGNMVLPAAGSWTVTWRVKQGTTPDANTVVQVGISCASNLTTDPASAIYFRATGATPTWYSVTRSASSETANDTTYSVSTSTWSKLVIRRVDASTIGFKVDANAETTHTTNIPTGQCNPWASVYNGATAATQSLDVEFFRLQATGISR